MTPIPVTLEWSGLLLSRITETLHFLVGFLKPHFPKPDLGRHLVECNGKVFDLAGAGNAFEIRWFTPSERLGVISQLSDGVQRVAE
jgi:hypothetical protein